MNTLTEVLRSPERLASLRRLKLLDTGPEPAFDRLTKLATIIYQVPVSLVVLLDHNRQFFKSCRGLPAPWCDLRETPLSHSFCQHILVARQPLVIADSRLHPDFINHPAIEDLGVIAYLGLPLVAVDGQAVGSFCVIDSRPRAWSQQDVEVLSELAKLVMYELEARVERLEREQAEQALREAQRLESLGRMAGGIAHDFNNVLMTVLGYAELAGSALPAHHPAHADLEEIQQAADRASRLVKHLLAFARQQTLQPQIINLNQLIDRLEPLLRPLLRENITLVKVLDPELSLVKSDPLQIEQILINLAINARDAMREGGTLVVTTANVILEPEQAQHYDNLPPGRYISLSMGDTGSAMTPEVQAQAFDPFFSTKAPEEGTGLGLAICYGIVKQHGGHIVLESELGQGTRVTVYLPASEDEVETIQPPIRRQLPRGNELVLLVEDDASVRSVVARMLHHLGYGVVEAGGGDEALALVRSWDGPPIKLLLSDVVMPGMSGPRLAAHLQERLPGLKTLFISGYSEHPALAHEAPVDEHSLLMKPFTAESLARRIRQLLDD